MNESLSLSKLTKQKKTEKFTLRFKKLKFINVQRRQIKSTINVLHKNVVCCNVICLQCCRLFYALTNEMLTIALTHAK